MPLVSVGLPVYNGEAMLPAALESLLGQTFQEIEVIICDNASTDGTLEIARQFEARDSRVSVHTSQRNEGAAWNFNRSFALAKGEYFKWASHDDLCGPTLIEKCVSVLSEDPDLVLCHCQSDEIDPEGTFLRHLHCPSGIASERPSERFRSLVMERHASIPIFGVIRSEILRRTPLIAKYVGSDWVLLCQLALVGKLLEIPEVMFWRTEHPGTSQNAYEPSERLEWFDSSKAGRIGFPHWRMAAELIRTVHGASLSATEKDACLRVVGSYVYQRSRGLRSDLFAATKRTLRKTSGGARIVESLKGLYHSRLGVHGG